MTGVFFVRPGHSESSSTSSMRLVFFFFFFFFFSTSFVAIRFLRQIVIVGAPRLIGSLRTLMSRGLCDRTAGVRLHKEPLNGTHHQSTNRTAPRQRPRATRCDRPGRRSTRLQSRRQALHPRLSMHLAPHRARSGRRSLLRSLRSRPRLAGTRLRLPRRARCRPRQPRPSHRARSALRSRQNDFGLCRRGSPTSAHRRLRRRSRRPSGRRLSTSAACVLRYPFAAVLVAERQAALRAVD